MSEMTPAVPWCAYCRMSEDDASDICPRGRAAHRWVLDTTPLVRTSEVDPLVVTVISCTVPVLMASVWL